MRKCSGKIIAGLSRVYRNITAGLPQVVRRSVGTFCCTYFLPKSAGISPQWSVSHLRTVVV